MFNAITTADKVAANKIAIQNEIASLYDHMVSTHKSIMRRVWRNQEDLTPQQVLDSFANEAVKLFIYGGKLGELINDVGEPYVPDLPYEYTINNDGTVTVGDLILPPEPSSSSSSEETSSSSSEPSSSSSGGEETSSSSSGE